MWRKLPPAHALCPNLEVRKGIPQTFRKMALRLIGQKTVLFPMQRVATPQLVVSWFIRSLLNVSKGLKEPYPEFIKNFTNSCQSLPRV